MLFMFRDCHVVLFVLCSLRSPAGKCIASWSACMRCFLVCLSLSYVVSRIRCGDFIDS